MTEMNKLSELDEPGEYLSTYSSCLDRISGRWTPLYLWSWWKGVDNDVLGNPPSLSYSGI